MDLVPGALWKVFGDPANQWILGVMLVWVSLARLRASGDPTIPLAPDRAGFED